MGVRWHVESRLESRDGSVCLCGVLSALAAGVRVWVSALRRGIVARARAASAPARASRAPRPLSLTFHCLSRAVSVAVDREPPGVPARLCSLFSSPSVPYSTLGNLTERRSESGVCGNDRIPAVSRNRRAVVSVWSVVPVRSRTVVSSHRAQASSTQGLYTRLKKCAKALRASRSSRSGSSYSCACSCSWAARRCASSRAPPSLRYPAWRRSPHGAHGCPNGW